MAVITIDGISYTVESGKNLLEVCLSEGLDLPYFCWHPAIGSVGACRQCAAKQFANKDDKRGRLITACMTDVQDGQIFSLQDPQAENFRATVIESLMTNHPHDCPVCEEGGECHLQDMTEMSGHTARRYRGKKRTHNNQQLGPLINHEMNRCISCYRCLRFYNDYAGGRDLAAFASHNHVYFGREKDGVLESEFAGNLVEVCPTGVFTDKPFSEHYSRKWDLQTAPSVCTHCAVGCNTTPGSRYGTVRRVVNRYHSEINGYFLCDRGRFGYGYNNHALRVLKHKTTDNSSDNSNAHNDSIGVEQLLRVAMRAGNSDTLLVGVGSARSSLENNMALQEFVGKENFYSPVSSAEYESYKIVAQQLMIGCLDIASIKQIEQADAIILLGEDIAETAPRVSLALRQAVRNKGIEEACAVGIHPWQDAAVRRYNPDTKTPLLIGTLTSTRLNDIASDCFHADPRLIAQAGFYIADQLSGKNSQIRLNEGQQRWADAVVSVLAQAKRPLIISGAGYQQLELTRSSLAIYSALKQRAESALFYYAFAEANSLGLALLTQQDKKSEQASNTVPIHAKRLAKDHSLEELVKELKATHNSNKHRVLIVLETDLYRAADALTVNTLLDDVEELIVLEHSATATLDKASTQIAVSTVLESQGTLISSEARAQRFYSVIPSPEGVQPAWCYLRDAAKRLVKHQSTVYSQQRKTLSNWVHCDDISNSIAQSIPALANVAILNSSDTQALARQTHRYSGRTAMTAHIAVAEKKPPQDNESPFTYSMEGLASHGPLENSAWSPGWNSNQAIHKFQKEISGELLQGESGVCLFVFNPEAPLPQFQPVNNDSHQASSSMVAFVLQHVFASDELSVKADAISSLASPACALINPIDAKNLQVKEWDTVLCSMLSVSQQLYVRLDSDMPKGIVGILQAGLGCLSNYWPAQVTLVKDENALPKPVSLIATDMERDNVY